MHKFTLVMTILILLVLGCGENKETTQKVESTEQNPATPEGKEKLFEDILNKTMDRLRYRDKSYIYELEFPYYREENTFDKFLENGKIRGAKADTLEFVDIVKLSMYEPDSAVAYVEVHFKGPTGKETILKGDSLTFYWYGDKWIRPTISTYDAQHQLDDIRQRADSAAQAEEEELGR
ncbi:MAG: hypothetical protein IH931_00700 [candidate division Zixibacteria bacterium]|nr:hypothetical protein [candidate division Zixibacteria bacterium]